MVLENKNILVTGALGLLGNSLVKELLRHGAKVLASDINIKKLREKYHIKKESLNSNQIDIFELDLNKKSDLVRFFNDLNVKLDGVVNCSYPKNRNYGNHFFDVDIKDFNENISLNLGSAFQLMQFCAKYFQKNKNDFSMVNIGSIYGVVSPSFEIYSDTKMTSPVEYSAIKSALLHLSKYIVKYINDSRFRINVVSPGGIYDDQPESFLKAYKKLTLGKGMLDADDVLGTIIFLLSSNSKFINGQNFIVDDGFVI